VVSENSDYCPSYFIPFFGVSDVDMPVPSSEVVQADIQSRNTQQVTDHYSLIFRGKNKDVIGILKVWQQTPL